MKAGARMDTCNRCGAPGPYRAGRCSGCISRGQAYEKAAADLEQARIKVAEAAERLYEFAPFRTVEMLGRCGYELTAAARIMREKIDADD